MRPTLHFWQRAKHLPPINTALRSYYTTTFTAQPYLDVLISILLFKSTPTKTITLLLLHGEAMFLVLKYAAKPYETNAEEKATEHHWAYGALLERQLLPHWVVVVLVIIMVVCEIRKGVGKVRLGLERWPIVKEVSFFLP